MTVSLAIQRLTCSAPCTLNPLLRRAPCHLFSPHLPFPVQLKVRSFATKSKLQIPAAQQVAPQTHSLEKALASVKASTAMRRHPGLQISCDDGIAAANEESGMKDLKPALEAIKKVLLWRKDLIAAFDYELEAMAKGLKARLTCKSPKAFIVHINRLQPFETQLHELKGQQAILASHLQDSLVRFTTLKAKVESSPNSILPKLNAVGIVLATNPPHYPVPHQWEERHLSSTPRGLIDGYIANELIPLHVQQCEDVVKLKSKLDAFEKLVG
jgi:hypothetical protein